MKDVLIENIYGDKVSVRMKVVKDGEKNIPVLLAVDCYEALGYGNPRASIQKQINNYPETNQCTIYSYNVGSGKAMWWTEDTILWYASNMLPRCNDTHKFAKRRVVLTSLLSLLKSAKNIDKERKVSENKQKDSRRNILRAEWECSDNSVCSDDSSRTIILFFSDATVRHVSYKQQHLDNSRVCDVSRKICEKGEWVVVQIKKKGYGTYYIHPSSIRE